MASVIELASQSGLSLRTNPHCVPLPKKIFSNLLHSHLCQWRVLDGTDVSFGPEFQLLHTPAAFNAERIAWRFVIYLNLLRSVRR